MRAWRFPIVLLVPALIIAAVVVQQRADTGPGSAIDSSLDAARLMPVAQRAGVANSTFYCAGGSATGTPAGFAEHTVTVANASGVAKTGRLTVYANNAEPVVRELTVGPASRLDTKLSDVLKADYAAAIVEVDGGEVAVEQSVAGPTGRSTAPCSSSPSDTWYFPSASTRPGARQVLAVFNPFPDPAVMDITFETDDGARVPQKLNPIVVAGGKVAGIDVTDIVTLRPAVATTVRTRTGSGRVVVDLLQSFDGKDGLEAGEPAAAAGPSGSVPPGTTVGSTTPSTSEPVRDAGLVGLAITPGAPTPVQTWLFPDGPPLREGTDERYVVMNPGDTSVQVAVQVRPDGGAQLGPIEPYEVTVRPGQYESVSLRSDGRVPTGSGHWVSVVSNGGPVVAARVLTAVAPASPAGYSATMGSPLLASRWLVAAADQEGTSSATVTVVNPSATDAVQITATAIRQGQAEPIEHYDHVDLPPGARTVIPANEQAAGPNLAVAIESSGSVLVEHALAPSGGGFSHALGEPVVGTLSVAAVSASPEGPGALDVIPPVGTVPFGAGTTVPGSRPPAAAELTTPGTEESPVEGDGAASSTSSTTSTSTPESSTSSTGEVAGTTSAP